MPSSIYRAFHLNGERWASVTKSPKNQCLTGVIVRAISCHVYLPQMNQLPVPMASLEIWWIHFLSIHSYLILSIQKILYSCWIPEGRFHLWINQLAQANLLHYHYSVHKCALISETARSMQILQKFIPVVEFLSCMLLRFLKEQRIKKKLSSNCLRNSFSTAFVVNLRSITRCYQLLKRKGLIKFLTILSTSELRCVLY